MNKKTLLGGSFLRINTPQNFVDSLHSDSCSDDLKIIESVNSEESTTDNDTPSNPADIQTPLIINDNLSSLTKPFMNMEAKFSALKGYKVIQTVKLQF